VEHPDITAARMTRQSILLGTLATALSLDLAVAPMVLGTPPGFGTITTTRGIAEALGMSFLEVRAALVDIGETGFIDRHLADGRPALIVLDEAGSATGAVLDDVLRRISENATAPVVVMMLTLPGGHDHALDAIVRTLGIESVDVPTDTLSA